MRPNLARHADGWPDGGATARRIKSGNPQRGREHIGEGHDTEGSRWIIERIDAGTPERPLNIAIWGGQTDLAQALWRVKHDRGDAGLRAFVRSFRVYDIDDQDGIADWMRDEFPGLYYILAKAPPGRDKREGDVSRHVSRRRRIAHQPRVDRASTSAAQARSARSIRLKTWTAPNPHGCMKEGDTPSWFFFLPLGGNDPDRSLEARLGRPVSRAPDGWYRDLRPRDGLIRARRSAAGGRIFSGLRPADGVVPIGSAVIRL